MPAPRLGRIQAVVWDGHEEHTTCRLGVGGGRHLLSKALLNAKELYECPDGEKRFAIGDTAMIYMINDSTV